MCYSASWLLIVDVGLHVAYTCGVRQSSIASRIHGRRQPIRRGCRLDVDAIVVSKPPQLGLLGPLKRKTRRKQSSIHYPCAHATTSEDWKGLGLYIKKWCARHSATSFRTALSSLKRWTTSSTSRFIVRSVRRHVQNSKIAQADVGHGSFEPFVTV